jgi:protein phosphatase
MKNLKIIWSVRTECGPKRERNEDAVFPIKSGSKDLPFKAAICDGLGGHVKGEIASSIATDSMNTKESDVSKIINNANVEITNYQKENSGSSGMGTTMTVVIIDTNGLMQVGHVGDSRCYVLSNRIMVKLTEDQNVPGYQNVLEQALGTKNKLDIQKVDFQLNEGDVVFLCTDGLYNEFGEEYLKKKLQEGVGADTLVGEALLQKPKDNVSAIVMNVI